MIYLKKILLIIIISIFVMPLIASAEANWVMPDPKIPIPGMDKIESPTCTQENGKEMCSISWLNIYIAGIYKYAIGIVAILATIVMMIGGVVWITAAGDSGRINEAKQWITGAVTGLVLAFSSYTILYFVNPDLVKLKPIRVEKIIKVEPEKNLISSKIGCSWKEIKNCPTGYLMFDRSNCTNPDSEDNKNLICCCPSSSQESKLIAENLISNKNIIFSTDADCSGYNAKTSITTLANQGNAQACDSDCNCSHIVTVDTTLLNKLDDLSRSYNLSVTSITTGKHTEDSLHYQGRAIDISTGNKNDWNAIVTDLKNNGFNAFCDLNGKSVSCDQASHIHYSTK